MIFILFQHEMDSFAHKKVTPNLYQLKTNSRYLSSFQFT